MTRFLMLFATVAFVLGGCGGVDSSGDLLEEATYSAALSEGDGENLDDVPVDEDLEAAAAEVADGDLDEGVDLNPDCSLDGLRQRVMNRYDQNGNGRLDRGERNRLAEELDPLARLQNRWMRHYRLQRLLWVHDQNEDGVLGQAEQDRLRINLQARCQNRQAALLDGFDADEDGSLNAEEWEAARLALQDRIQARVQDRLQQHDANGDGQLDENERRAMIAAAEQRMQQQREQLRLQYDANGDGQLDQQERATLREMLQARVRGEQFTPDTI